MQFHEFFADNLRDSLFSGFLVMAGFLFSAKTFVLIHMKEKVYDSPGYEKRLADRRISKPGLTRHGPLTRFSKLLFVSVLASLLTAILQLALGLVASDKAAWACITVAVIATCSITVALFLIQANIKDWLYGIDENERTATQA